MGKLGANIRKRVLLYLFVFVLCAIWGLIHRVYQLVTPGHKPLAFLSFCEALFNPLNGALNALVYGVSQKVFTRYRNRCCKTGKDGRSLRTTVQRGNSKEATETSNVPNVGDGFYSNDPSTFATEDGAVFVSPSPSSKNVMRPLLG